MTSMTDAEAERLDEYYTKNTIIPVGGKVGALDRLKQNLRPGEVLSFKCIIEKDGQELAGVFTKVPGTVLGRKEPSAQDVVLTA